MIHGYLLQLKPSRTSLMLEDIDHHDLPGGCQNDWSHHHQSGITLRFSKIYATWVFVEIKAIKKILEFGRHPDHPDIPDGCQDDWSRLHQSRFTIPCLATFLLLGRVKKACY